MTDAWATSLTGLVLGGYRLERCVGNGEFGYVFEVTKIDTASSFAMKVLSPGKGSDASAHVDFDNESALLKKLNPCSSVINLVDSGSDDVMVTLGGVDVPLQLKYHVLVLASGSLDELLRTPELVEQLAWPERLRLWRGAIKGVHQMHLKSIAHRDLKTSNCLLMVVSNRTEVRLTDLGRSKDYSTPASLPPEFYLGGRGDLRFAPPEYLLLQGSPSEVDFKNADLYGLGSLLAELATGHPMSALALTSWQDVRQDGIADLRAGVRRDLATLRPHYQAAIEGIADDLPSAIRYDTKRLLLQLCDPVPHARQPKKGTGHRHVPDDGLLWLLRRADILQRQLSVAPRRIRYKNQTIERSA
ncbi:MAG TPA: serine/threonine-protein kinase [Jatrophihabitans sp.]